MLRSKNSAMGRVVTIFVTVLIISLIAGLTFLFVAELKNETEDISLSSNSIENEEGFINSTGYTLDGANSSFTLSQSFSIDRATDNNGTVIPAENYSVSSGGVVTNATSQEYSDALFNYSFKYLADEDAGAYEGVNTTESAGLTVTSFLTILFLALIFSAILAVVFRIVMPFIRLGNRMGGDGF